jgi:exosortase/archaeosortase family protein
MWVRVALVLLTIPLAICANAVRVALSALHPRLSEGTPHMLLGAVLFMLSLSLLAVFERLLKPRQI